MTNFQSLALTSLAAFAASLALTAIMRPVARRWGVVDHPDGFRKFHQGPVPLLGGVAVYLAVILGLLTAHLGSFGTGQSLDELARVVAAAAGFVCLFGCIDDCYRLRPRVKLLLQTCAVLPVVLAGYYADQVIWFGYTIEFGWLGIPLTVLWLLGCINAINLLDGMDGLASTVGISTAVTMGVIAAYMGNDYVAVVAAALAAALAGFLVHNLPPAKIFLGDSGSMVIGLIVGVLGVQSTLKTSATLSITAPLVVMTFPIFDSMLAVVRRRLTGQSVAAADRHHIHHRLLDRGMGPWLVLTVIGALCVTTGVAALVATVFRIDALAWVTAALLLVLVVRLRLFGHYEVALVAGFLARAIAGAAARAAGRTDEEAMAGGDLGRLSNGEAWDLLVESVRPWKVHQLQLVVSDAEEIRWRQAWSDPDEPAGGCIWTLGVEVRDAEGRCCRLRVAGFDAAGPEFASPSGLARMLRRFAGRFAARDAIEHAATDGRRAA